MPSVESQSPSDLAAVYEGIRAEAVRLAGGPGDMPQRVALLHSIFADSGVITHFPRSRFMERCGRMPSTSAAGW